MPQATIPTLHHLTSSISFSVLVALEEIASQMPDLKYNIQIYTRNPGNKSAPPELKNVHPLGKSPVLVVKSAPDHISERQVLIESRLILQYIADTYSDGSWTPTPADAQRDALFQEFVRSTVHSKANLAIPFNDIPTALPFGFRQLVRAAFSPILNALFADLVLYYGYIKDQLSEEKAWLPGEKFGLADLNAIFTMDMVVQKNFGWDAEKWPKLADWYARIIDREAYKRALAKGGLYDVVNLA